MGIKVEGSITVTLTCDQCGKQHQEVINDDDGLLSICDIANKDIPGWDIYCADAKDGQGLIKHLVCGNKCYFARQKEA